MLRGRAMESSQSLNETTRAASTDASFGHLSLITDFSSIDSDFGEDHAPDMRVNTPAARRAMDARRKPSDGGLEVSLPKSQPHQPIAAHQEEESAVVLRLVDELGRTFRLAAGAGHMSIGRARRCDIVFAFEVVSNKHALLVSTPQCPSDFILHDLGSNGTYVNGVKMVVKQHKLKLGDVLHFGKVKDATRLRVAKLGSFLLVNGRKTDSHIEALSSQSKNIRSSAESSPGAEASSRASLSSSMLSRQADILSANLDLESNTQFSRLPSISFGSHSRAATPLSDSGHGQIDRCNIEDGRRSQFSVANTVVSTASKQSVVYTRLQTVRRELSVLLNGGEEPVEEDLQSSIHNSESEEDDFVEKQEEVAKEVKKPLYRYGDRVMFKHRVPGIGITRAQGIITNVRTVRDEGPELFFRNLDEDKILCLVNCKPSTRTKQQALMEVESIVEVNRPDGM
ncbi:hypothetical protein GUITHDRAFT_105775 [Guillardia theta CCMP2712]|uniref:FHA domain-containing protein n=1 Tax=Guillardia theta (strain CCMP2712) TaxID=905079 RepID=L1JKL3_GUITC|nr:hypothetical protein GUITHDRAFT_105775 [Guillardia theta CCMP2712]EKX48630.1 hypothetical protein GUITHDRAFT_105775 [Guillardia theta CCMP2712]|eukprot:XP_005835610.1 hypothetical protein GUITHDRAFT_105775 [Guillardia theta CCMP2712]